MSDKNSLTIRFNLPAGWFYEIDDSKPVLIDDGYISVFGHRGVYFGEPKIKARIEKNGRGFREMRTDIELNRIPFIEPDLEADCTMYICGKEGWIAFRQGNRELRINLWCEDGFSARIRIRDEKDDEEVRDC